jgi:predicted adenine nucleotide alpha hydrolase (AANH) superfamily ATPase
MNYQKELEKLIDTLDHKPTLLLHSCCAPCSSHCITYLKDYFDITILYYNPNIEPYSEYIKRKNEQIRLCEILNIKYIDISWDNNSYREFVKGLESEKEGGRRCVNCIKMRLLKTYELSKDYEYFGTTLTVSPHKNSKLINELGLEIDGTKYLISDFKKQEGYKKSIELSKKYELYRQDYCGCLFSKRSKDN